MQGNQKEYGKYWIHKKYSKAILEEIMETGLTEIKSLAMVSNFMGWLNYMIWTNESRTHRGFIFQGKLIHSTKFSQSYKDNSYYYDKLIPSLLIDYPKDIYTTIYNWENLWMDNMEDICPPIKPTKERQVAVSPSNNQGVILVEMIQISRSKLRKLLGDNYKEHLKLLEGNGLIVIDPRHSKNGRICRSFGITGKGKKFLFDCESVYLEKLLTDKGLIRKRQKRLSKLKAKQKMYEDPVLQNIKDMIDGIENVPDLLRLVPRIRAKEGDKHEEAQSVALYCLRKILEKSYNDLQFNQKTGRVYTPLSGLNKEILKKNLIIDGKHWCASTDIRSCIPTFFGLYCQRIYKFAAASDKQRIDKAELSREVAAYTEIFTREKPHPRKYLAQVMGSGYDDDQIKNMLNKGLNGSCLYECKEYREWIKKSYPNMYRIWRTTDIRTTGSNLSKHYEGPIFRNAQVIAKAKKLHLHYLDNHDEALLFGESWNADKFIEWFIKHARKIAGIEVQFSIEQRTDSEKEEAA